MWFNDPVQLVQLVVRILADTEPVEKTDGAYLFGNTPDHELSILDQAVMLSLGGKTRKLCLCGGGPYYSPVPTIPLEKKMIGYSGFAVWKKYLESRGVTLGDIIEIPRPELSHTHTEAMRFVQYAKALEWKTAYIVAVPFHILRAICDIVGVIVKEYPEFRVYVKPGIPQNWYEKTIYSQGFSQLTRLESITGEIERIEKWFAKGDMPTCDEVLEYFKRRDES